MTGIRSVLLGFVFVSLLGCPNPDIPTTGSVGEIPEECQLSDGLSVEVLTIDTPDEFDVGTRNVIPVKVKLNQPASHVEFVCFIVRDVQTPVSMPIAMGVMFVPPNQERGGTTQGFILKCDGNNDVVGESFGLVHDLDASTKERSTKIFIQHVEDRESLRTLGALNPATQQFVQIVRGLNGVKSNRPRATCPN